MSSFSYRIHEDFTESNNNNNSDMKKVAPIFFKDNVFVFNETHTGVV